MRYVIAVSAAVLVLAASMPLFAQDRGGNVRGSNASRAMNVDEEMRDMTDLAKAKTDLQHARLTERQLRSRSQLKKAINRYCANELNAGTQICTNTPQF